MTAGLVIAAFLFLIFLPIGLIKNVPWGLGLSTFFAGWGFLTATHDLGPDGPPIGISIGLILLGGFLMFLGGDERQRSKLAKSGGVSRSTREVLAHQAKYADLQPGDTVRITRMGRYLRKGWYVKPGELAIVEKNKSRFKGAPDDWWLKNSAGETVPFTADVEVEFVSRPEPKKPTEPEPYPWQAGGTSTPKPGQRTLLLVDDDPMFRNCCRTFLHFDLDEVCVVGEAEDGHKALRLAEELQTDIIVTDIKHPGPSGIEIARKLSTTQPSTRVVVMSEVDNYVTEAREAGAASYLLKRNVLLEVGGEGVLLNAALVEGQEIFQSDEDDSGVK